MLLLPFVHPRSSPFVFVTRIVCLVVYADPYVSPRAPSLSQTIEVVQVAPCRPPLPLPLGARLVL